MPKKKSYETPELKSEKLFERKVLACGKRDDENDEGCNLGGHQVS